MNRFSVLLGLSLMIAATSAQANEMMNRLSAHVAGITTLTAPFIQTNADGSRSKGVIYIKRPGRMRVEYDDRSALVVASAGTVAIKDGKSNSPPEKYPLSKTPLWNILRPDIDLTRAKGIVGMMEQDGVLSLTVLDVDRPEVGTLELRFRTFPEIDLIGWVSTSDFGERTEVRLGEKREGNDLKSSLFSLE